MHNRFNRVGNNFARHQTCAHALVTHTDSVGHGDGAELKRYAASGTDTLLGCIGKTTKRHVARRYFIPRACKTNLWLLPVVIGKAHCAQHGACGCFLVAVGDVAATGFDVDGGAVCCGHGSHGTQAVT